MMFKNETLVQLMMCMIMTISSSAFAAKADEEETNGMGVLAKKIYEETCGTPELKEKNKTTCEDFVDSVKSWLKKDAGTNCKDEAKDYQKAKGEFVGACGNIPGESTPGNVGCGYALERCACQNKSTFSAGKADKLNCTNDDQSYATRNASTLINVAAEREKFKFCPVLAAKDREKLEKDIAEKRKEVKALEKKIPELQEAISEAQSQAQEKVREAKAEMAEAAAEYGKQKKEAKRQQEEAANQLSQQLLQLQEEITKTEEQRGQIRLNRKEAEVKRSETITQIELNCHATASAQVNKMQGERLELERTRNLNRGGFGDLLKNVGVSDRAQWQRVAKKYYDWCIQSSPTRKSKESANKIYESALQAADQAERNLDQRKADIQKRMEKIKNKSGCGGGGTDSEGESTESAMCQAARRAQEDMAQVDKDYLNKQNVLREKAGGAMQDGQRKAATKAMALQQAASELADENTRLKNLEEYLAAKNEAANGASVDAKEYAEARAKYMLFRGAAEVLAACGEKNKKCDSACMEAATYMNVVGDLEDNRLTTLRSFSDKVDKDSGGSKPNLAPESESVPEKPK